MKRRQFCASALVLPGVLGLGSKIYAKSGNSGTPKSEPKRTRRQFFDHDAIQDLFLEIDAQDWQRLRANYLKNDYYPCAFVWNGMRFDGAALRSHGSSPTRSQDKPSLRVDMNRVSGKTSFKKVKSFLLNNCIQDPTFLKDNLAMQLFRRAGIPAPARAFSRVYVNGEYWGLYSLAEEMDKSFRRRKLNEHGGYLYKLKKGAACRFDNMGDSSRLAEMFTCLNHSKKPKFGALQKLFERVAGTADEDFVATVGRQLDWSQLLKYAAVETFIDDRRGLLAANGAAGFRLYRFKSNGLIWLLPWSKSRSFHSAESPVYHDAGKNVMIRRAMAIPTLQRLYTEKLARVVEKAGNAGGWLNNKAGSLYIATRDSALADPFKRGSDSAYDKAVNQLADFTGRRTPFVTAQLRA